MSERVVIAIAQKGGVAAYADILRTVSRQQLRSAVTNGAVERVSRGVYALPALEESKRAAVVLGGAVSHRSAALHHGWSLRSAPERPEVIVPRSRDLPLARRRARTVRWRDLGQDVENGVTGPLRTVIDCARDLPLEESLAVADSALRSGALTSADLIEAAAGLPRTHRRRAALVLHEASAEAANPFESALRALAIEAVGRIFTPQVTLEVSDGEVTPDLVCPELRIVIEADSHEFHTSRSQIVKDCWRYNELLLAGWLVLRFAWVQVMFHQGWVRDTITRAVARSSPHRVAVR